ncbi:response regulator transcription factor [Adlercreutzia sp. R21]|uniref:response regulator transcription factor n=1 Tax=Adlercreutzia wanghongyangiae TaxID=3111451 RepID=UPI002DBF4638|nr:response regulator transcription factor [Adlercreutzia sp. R21]MEC4185244.1 response regulator transcription factor [Adlercreutzia sp. R21]
MVSDVMRIMLVDDHALLRSGLAAMLEYEEDVEVVGEAADGLEAVALYDRLLPDVVVMDVTMPKMGGIEASRAILERHPDARILIMTQHEEQKFIEAILAVDISGCIGKKAAGDEFCSALRAVNKGEFYLHPAMARLVASAHRKRLVDPIDTLTPRENEVLACIVRGDTNQQIACDLRLSVKTVEWHRSNLMAKLNTHSIAELVRYALEKGIGGSGGQIDRI